MATQIALQTTTRDGAVNTRIMNPSGEYAMPNTSQNSLLVVDNSGGAAAIDITIHSQKTYDGLNIPDRTLVEVGIGVVKTFGPFPADGYNLKTGADANHVAFLVADGDASSAMWATAPGSL